jgi:hypothetical protein
LYRCVYARGKDKCVTCCGHALLSFNIAEVGITGPKWREIKNAVIHKMLTVLYRHDRANAPEELTSVIRTLLN